MEAEEWYAWCWLREEGSTSTSAKAETDFLGRRQKRKKKSVTLGSLLHHLLHLALRPQCSISRRGICQSFLKQRINKRLQDLLSHCRLVSHLSSDVANQRHRLQNYIFVAVGLGQGQNLQELNDMWHQRDKHVQDIPFRQTHNDPRVRLQNGKSE